MEAGIETLFSRLVDQALSDGEAAELVDRLRKNQADADEFLELMRIHFLLAENCGPVKAFSIDELRAIKAIDSRFDKFVAAAAPMSTTKDSCRVTPWAWLAVAATLGMAVSLWRPWGAAKPTGNIAQRGQSQSNSAASMAARDDWPDGIVAKVERKIDCDWAEDRWSTTASGQIQEGQLITLTKGLLILQFADGAEVTLSGPASLAALSKSRVQLIRGELTASVPPQARGFRVETHAGNFVDLGTEFGLLVDEDGQVETHVFKGEVVAEADAGGRSQSTSLKTGDAWARMTSGPIETGLGSEPGKFLRPLRQGDDSAVGAATFAITTTEKLTLHYAADQFVQRGADDRVSEWGDLVDRRSNTRRENAWQVDHVKRPLFIAKSINGRPALRFDGYRALVTEPVKIGASQTSAIVFRTDGDVARELIADRTEYQELGVQLLNMNSIPNMVVQVSKDLSLIGRVHLGYLPERPDPVDVGYVKSTHPIDNDPHVVVYCFDAEEKVASLYLDGDLLGSSRDISAVATTTAPRYIGSHFTREGFGFTGDIAEVLVYDRALAASEASEVSTYLADKYGLPAPSLNAASLTPTEVRE